MMRWSSLDRVVTARAILLVGWVLFLVYAYPGYMSFDSVWQLEQARHLEPINDWHPPLMALIWRLTDAIIAGPFPMLVIQSTAFLLGAAALLRQVLSARAAAIVAVVVLLVPQTIVVMAVIWKDSLMAGCLLASIAALLAPQRRWRIAGYAFVFVATAVRYNAAAATLPIVFCLFARDRPMIWWKRYPLAVGLWIAITAAAFVVNGLLVQKKTYVWQSGSATVDIAGMVNHAPTLSDAELRALTPGVPWSFTQDVQRHVREGYRDANCFLDVTGTERKVMELPTTEAQRAALTAAWKTLVRGYPLAFLQHRIAMFRSELELPSGGGGHMWAAFSNEAWAEDTLKHRAKHSMLQRRWIEKVVRLGGKVSPHVWVYFTLALLLLPMCRRDRLAFLVLTSGLLYELGLLLVLPATDYRYSHWLVVTTLLGTVILLVTRSRRRPPDVVSAPELG